MTSNQPPNPAIQWGCLAILLLCGGGYALDSWRRLNPASSPSSVPVATAFDVPSLVGLNIDGVRRALGTGTSDTAPSPGFKTWHATFKRGEQSLIVHYQVATGRVLDFFLTTPSNDRTKEGAARMMLANGLGGTQTNYRLEVQPVFGRPAEIGGVRIIPK